MHTTLQAFFPEGIVESGGIRYIQHIGISVFTQIPLPDAWKIPLKGRKVEFAVAGPQRHPEKAYHKAATGIGGHLDNARMLSSVSVMYGKSGLSHVPVYTP